jgi:hypothetical protein
MYRYPAVRKTSENQKEASVGGDSMPMFARAAFQLADISMDALNPGILGTAGSYNQEHGVNAGS